ncbi:hypothetical protein COOONC_06630, partial [Cooperia oncophora]
LHYSFSRFQTRYDGSGFHDSGTRLRHRTHAHENWSEETRESEEIWRQHAEIKGEKLLREAVLKQKPKEMSSGTVTKWSTATDKISQSKEGTSKDKTTKSKEIGSKEKVGKSRPDSKEKKTS